MHNRIRVVCASFLVKNLLLPWQWGLKHYWDALLDADLECDALGWQYVSGCLAGAAPPGSYHKPHTLINQSLGLKHYWDALLDADLECDALGWQ